MKINILQNISRIRQNNTAIILPFFNNSGELEGEKRISYGELIQQTAKFNHFIKDFPDEKPIIIMMENSEYFCFCLCGALTAGKLVLAVDPLLKANEIQDIIKRTDSTIVFSDNIGKYFVSPQKINKIVSTKQPLRFTPSNIDNVILYSCTSGTTGRSKIVKITNRNLATIIKLYKKYYQLNKKSKVLVALPLYHNFGMFASLLPSLCAGSELIILKKWNAANAIEIINKYKITNFTGSPFMYQDMIQIMKEKSISMPSLKVCDVGGTTIPLSKIKEFEKFSSAIITEGYGLTETSSLTHFNYPLNKRKIGSIGKPVEGVEQKLLNSSGTEQVANHLGILWVRGPMVAAGYLDDPIEESKRFKDGWFNTEDIIRIDKDGYCYFGARLSDIMNYERNILPREIEEKLYELPDIKDCVILAEYNKKTQKMEYAIHIISDTNIGKNEIHKMFPQLLIKRICYHNSFPKTRTGKIKRFAIK